MRAEEKIRELEGIIEEQEKDVVLLLRRVADAERERDNARDVACAFQAAAQKLQDDLALILPFVVADE